MSDEPTWTAAAPKVLLHDHLDGGLRPITVLELAADIGHPLPAQEPDALARWFFQGNGVVDLPGYLEAFDQTVAVMQTPEALRRVARECAEDLAADGVVYAEVRFAPELSTAGGLSCGEVLEAIAAGFADGPDGIEIRQLVCALRHLDRAEEAFEAAVEARHLGVVGIDLAGPEAGFPPANHARAIARAREAGLHVTLHAGEADGPGSIAAALDQGAERIGHGVRIVDDLAADGTAGPVARRLLDGAIPLELCPSSNVHTGAVATLDEHPIMALDRAGFTVTLNTDNRLMSGVSASSEAALVARRFGATRADLERWTLAAIDHAFADETTRAAVRARIVDGYTGLSS